MIIGWKIYKVRKSLRTMRTYASSTSGLHILGGLVRTHATKPGMRTAYSGDTYHRFMLLKRWHPNYFCVNILQLVPLFTPGTLIFKLFSILSFIALP